MRLIRLNTLCPVLRVFDLAIQPTPGPSIDRFRVAPLVVAIFAVPKLIRLASRIDSRFRQCMYFLLRLALPILSDRRLAERTSLRVFRLCRRLIVSCTKSQPNGPCTKESGYPDGHSHCLQFLDEHPS